MIPKITELIFQSKTSVKQGAHYVDTWGGDFNISGVLDDTISRASARSGQSGHEIVKTFACDYDSRINDNLRIKFDSKYYLISDVKNPNHLNIHLEIDLYAFE